MDNSFKNRIQKIMELEQLNPASFAKAIQINPSAVSHILSERNKPSTEIIVKILNTFRNINSDWLLLGIGSMYRNDKVQNPVVETTMSGLFDVMTTENTKSAEEKTIVVEDKIRVEEPIIPPIQIQANNSVKNKKLRKIIVYYSDNSFEEFISQE